MGCTNLEIPNVEICRDKGKLGAVCAYTRGEADVRQVPFIEWANLRFGQLCMSPESLGDYKILIEKACQENKNCVDGVRRVLDGLGEPKQSKAQSPIRQATPEEIERFKRTGHIKGD